MVGSTRKDENGNRKTHFDLLQNEDIKRWYDNLKAKSPLTAGVYLRGMGFYCNKMNTSPEKILEDGKAIKPLQVQFDSFVRMMEGEGKAGAYIARYKKIIHSWTKYNDVDFKSNTIIRDENINLRTQSETVFTPEELGRILRHSSLRAKVEISLMAFAGLRPRSISNEDGSDCIKIGDIPELRIRDGHVEFDKEPVRIIVRYNLNKGRKHGYTTFLGPEGMTYLKEYLESRISDGEVLNDNSPIVQYDRNVKREHAFIPTFYIEREIRGAIIGSGFFTMKENKQQKEFKSATKRPYLLRAYFATAMDISEQKGYVSHPWRQYWMGHSGDMESRYSTNKNLRDSEIEEMRQAYSKCLQYLETEHKGLSEDEVEKKFRTQLLLMAGFSEQEIQDKNLLNMKAEEITRIAREKLLGMNTRDISAQIQKDKQELSGSHKQKVVPIDLIEHYINNGFIVRMALGNDKAIVELLP